MKKKIIIALTLVFSLFTHFVAFVFIWAITTTITDATSKHTSDLPEAETGYLLGLQDQYLSVMSELEKQGMSVSYDDIHKELIIESSEAYYYFSSEGAVLIGVLNSNAAYIHIESMSDSGKIEEIDIFLGDALGSTRNKYSVDKLDKPKAYFLGDSAKTAEKEIKKYLPNEKIKELLAQAEKYQETIKQIINNLNTPNQ